MHRKYAVVKKYLDEYDYYSLLEQGAPRDEFEDEARQVSTLISEKSTEAEIAQVIAAVFARAFGNDEQPENYMGIAGKIREEIIG